MSKTKRNFISFHAVAAKTVDGERAVKGFVSMNNVDRSQDIVTPESFNLKRFMANPQMLLDHKFFKDEQGNDRSVGLVKQAAVAKLLDIGSDEEFGVFDEAGNQIDTLSKERVPEATSGSRGLFVRAVVTLDKVWEMVKSGELNSFSWRGFARMANVVVAGVERLVTHSIDLMEVSLVHIPDNFSSTFEIAKSVEGVTDLAKFSGDVQQLVVQRVLFSADVFSDEEAKSWLDRHGFGNNEIEKVEGEFSSTQVPLDSFDKEMMLSMQVATGVQVIVGQQKTNEKSLTFFQNNGNFTAKDHFALLASLLLEANLKAQTTPEDEMAKQAKKTDATPAPEKGADAVTDETTPVEETVKTTEETPKTETPKTEEPKTDEAPAATVKGLEALDTEQLAKLLVLLKAAKSIDDEAFTTVPEEGSDIHAVLVQLAETMGAAKSVDVNNFEEMASALSSKTAELVLAGVDEKLSAFDSRLEEVAKGIASTDTEKQSEEKVETEAGEVSDFQKALSLQMGNVTDALKAMSKTVASPSTEREEAAPEGGEKSLNEVFGGGNWPFRG
jgi:hypothetical protein